MTDEPTYREPPPKRTVTARVRYRYTGRGRPLPWTERDASLALSGIHITRAEAERLMRQVEREPLVELGERQEGTGDERA